MDSPLIVPAEALEEYARRYGIKPSEVIGHLRERWEAAERLSRSEFRLVPYNPEPLELPMIDIAEPRSPEAFLLALRVALGSDWSWTDDLSRRLWVVEHRGGLRFELADAGFERRAALEEAPRLASVLLDAVEDGRKGLVTVLISKRTVETVAYSYQVVSAEPRRCTCHRSREVGDEHPHLHDPACPVRRS